MDQDDHSDWLRVSEVWSANGLNVRVTRTEDGGLHIEGQDLNPNPFGSDEYEYALTIVPEDVATIQEALNGSQEDDPIALIRANIDAIIHVGEMNWLNSLGIKPGFWSHF